MSGTMNITEAAEFLKVPESTLYEMATSRMVPSTKIGRRWVFSTQLLKDKSKWRRKRASPRRLPAKVLLAAMEKISAHAGLIDDFYQQLPLPLRFSIAAHAGKRKKIIRRATPAWADLNAIERMYSAAKAKTLATGIPHTVDHVIPLQGKMVCGLHIHQNMSVTAASENFKKYNKWDDENV